MMSGPLKLVILLIIRLGLKQQDLFIETEQLQTCCLADRLKRILNCCLCNNAAFMHHIADTLALIPLYTGASTHSSCPGTHFFTIFLRKQTPELNPSVTSTTIRSTQRSIPITTFPDTGMQGQHHHASPPSHTVAPAGDDVQLHRFLSWIPRSEKLYG
jgi:hypothetical protein